MSKHSGDHFYQLPEELLLKVVKLSLDFSSPWGIINASPTINAMLAVYPIEILEAVTDLAVPAQTQRLMWAGFELPRVK